MTTSEINVRAATADTSKAFGRLMWRVPSAVSYRTVIGRSAPSP